MTLRVPVEQTPGDVAHKLMHCAVCGNDWNVLEVVTSIKQNMRALKRKGEPHVASTLTR